LNNEFTDDDDDDDDEDIKREIRNLFMRTNLMPRRFSRCSIDVKLLLFKSYTVYVYMMLPCGTLHVEQYGLIEIVLH